ncbi:MAG: hypothetical protein EPO55_21405 [Reyranella sp.]|nr:MAG: hypothetical protein EPO55_21405 [Reyranella sp.]
MTESEKPSSIGRFQKGQSGNLKGRPRAARERQASAFDIVVRKTLTVTQNGVPRLATIEETLQQKTYLAAIGGNRPAQREIFKMIEKREQWLAAKGGRKLPPVIRRLEPVDPDNADEALKILGIATHDESRDGWGDERDPLLLEPWGVQAALSRRRGGERLRNEEAADIKRSTRSADRLRWPRGNAE